MYFVLPRCRTVRAPAAARSAMTVFAAHDRKYAPYTGGAVDNNQLLEEKDACGVGYIASLKVGAEEVQEEVQSRPRL